MASHDPLIIQVASGGAVERQVRTDPPPSVANGAAVLDAVSPGPDGRLEPPAVGEVVLTVPSPETLTREPAELRRVIDGAGPGVEPLVVVVEAAEELREDELATIVDAARGTRRSVILRIAADA